MESSWRWNVWELGLTPGPDLPGIGLVARSHVGFPPNGYLTNCPVFPNHARVVYLPDTVLPEQYYYTEFQRTGNHFPYGIPVDPDTHP